MNNTRQQLFYLAIILFTLLDILLLVYILFYPVSSTFKYGVVFFDFILCIVMWIEFIYSFLHADDRKQYFRSNAFSILGMFPLDFAFLRALRLIKLMQFIKLFVLARETTGNISKFLKHTYLDKITLTTILFVFTVTILTLLCKNSPASSSR